MYNMPETEEERDKEVKAVIERVNEEMQMLLDFLLKYYPNDFGVGESVIEIAIKLLKKHKEVKQMSAKSEINRLADFIMKYYPYEIGKETSESAVDVAIRLIKSNVQPSIINNKKEVK